jgi:oxygen-dependent protoporphyrinogen oxidase
MAASATEPTAPSVGTEKSVAVVGGGISGLATAYYVQRLARERGTPVAVTVFEASDRVGGTIETARADGFTMERGPDSIVTDKRWGLELCELLGLEPRLVPTDQHNRGSFIARGKRLLPVPEGFHLLAPSRL